MTDGTLTSANDTQILAENVPFEDFLQRYDGQRVEWHAGKVVKKKSNNETHQNLQNLLQTLITLYLMFRQIGRLYCDGYPMFTSDDQAAREPDIMVVLQEHYDRIKQQYLDGAADLCIEIISPSTGSVDRGEKFYEYQEAGVREYWIIDPQSKETAVYRLDDNGKYRHVLGSETELTSVVLPNFVLDSALLWGGDYPDGADVVNLVQAMVAGD